MEELRNKLKSKKAFAVIGFLMIVFSIFRFISATESNGLDFVVRIGLIIIGLYWIIDYYAYKQELFELVESEIAKKSNESNSIKFEVTKVDPIEEVNKSDDIAVQDYDFRPTYPTGSTPDQIISFPNFYEPNEVIKLFSDCQLKRADWEELYMSTRTLDFTNYTPYYFKEVNFIRDFIVEKVPDEYREKVAFDFTKYVEERNYKVLKNALDAEESHLFGLKTRRGRLNSIARFEDNYYLYREYFSRGNLDFLNEGIANLKDRYHLDQDEISEQGGGDN